MRNFFRRKSSCQIAKDRLKILLISDRVNCSPEMMELIKKYDVKRIFTWGAADKHSLLGERDEFKRRREAGYQNGNRWNYIELCTDISGIISGQILGIRGGLAINMEKWRYCSRSNNS